MQKKNTNVYKYLFEEHIVFLQKTFAMFLVCLVMAGQGEVRGQEDPSGAIKKYDKNFAGIGPQVYFLPPTRSPEEDLVNSYREKVPFQDSIARALDFQRLVEEFKPTSNATSIESLLATMPVTKADWFHLIEKETDEGNYAVAYGLLHAYADQALRGKDIKETLGLLNKALEQAQKGNNALDISTIQYNLSNVYFYNKDVLNAGRFQEERYKNAVQQKSGIEQAASLIKIALIQAYDKDYRSAEDNIIRKAIPLLNKAKAYDQKVGAWVSLARIYQWQNKHTEAQWFLIQARDLAKSKNISDDLAEIEYLLAYSKLAQKNYVVAQQELVNADKLAKLEKNKVLQLAIVDRLGQVYLDSRDLKKAASLLLDYQTLKAEIFNNK